MNKGNLRLLIDKYRVSTIRKTSLLFQHILISFLVFRVFVGEDALAVKGGRAAFGKMVDGTANRPFVLRTLIPSTIRIIDNILPVSIKNHLKSFFERRNWFVEYLRSDRAVEYAIALALCFVFFLGFSFVLRRLAKNFYNGDSFLQHIVVFTGMLIIPLCFAYGHYIYDPGTIFLFSLGVLLIVEKRLISMMLIFPIIVLNKETSVLLILVFFIYEYRQMPLKKLVLLSTIMGIAWLIIRILILKAFAGNPGSTVEFHLFNHNLRLFANPVAAIYFLVVITVLGLLISHEWKSKQKFLRQGFLAVFIPMFSLAIFFGYVDELREFYEVVPFVALLIAPSIMKLTSS